jgi:hypothetical protein
VLKNLRERLKELMDRKQSSLPEGEEHASDAVPAKAQGFKDKSRQEIVEPQAEAEGEKHYRTIPPTPYQRQASVSYCELQKQGRREKHFARYQDVRTLSMQRPPHNILALAQS